VSDGSVSAKGEFKGGKKNGYWNSFAPGGKIRSEATYVLGSGEYREYHPSGKLKVKGKIENGKNHGIWNYYAENGQLEGECDFVAGTGTYKGYFASGSLQTKGTIENNLRVGTWELYEEDGKLSGYYKPVYENNIINRFTRIIFWLMHPPKHPSLRKMKRVEDSRTSPPATPNTGA